MSDLEESENWLERERLKLALEPFAEIGRRLNTVSKDALPDGASARYLKLDGLEARHFRAAADALAQQ